jgi:hypothetical protein
MRCLLTVCAPPVDWKKLGKSILDRYTTPYVHANGSAKERRQLGSFQLGYAINDLTQAHAVICTNAKLPNCSSILIQTLEYLLRMRKWESISRGDVDETEAAINIVTDAWVAETLELSCADPGRATQHDRMKLRFKRKAASLSRTLPKYIKQHRYCVHMLGLRIRKHSDLSHLKPHLAPHVARALKLMRIS